VLFLDEIGELGLDEQAMCLRAIEEKRFLPMGSDRTVDLRLPASSPAPTRICRSACARARFREDLFARLNLWTFQLAGPARSQGDIEPNLDFELRRFGEREGQNVTFNKEARELYLTFAVAPDAALAAPISAISRRRSRAWRRLRPKAASTRRRCASEITRLSEHWRAGQAAAPDHQERLADILGRERVEEIDLFDRAQLAAVIAICRENRTLSAAGRQLFSVSRQNKTSGNDADRLRKYLARFQLRFEDLSDAPKDR
jgi:transcriptional regulatory protein RtcR